MNASPSEARDSRPGGGPQSGFRLPIDSLRMLRGDARLRRLALVPLVISLVAVVAAVSSVIGFAGSLSGWIEVLLPSLEAGSWYTWLWVGPGRLLFWLLGKLLFLAAGALCVIGAFLLASVAAAPFHDALSRRVEQLVTGRVDEVEEPGLLAVVREGGRSLVEELRRLLFFVSVSALLVATGFVLPGAHLVTAPLLTVLTMLFLPLDYASYTLDRRRLSFRAKRQWLRDHTAPVLGYGAAAFILCAIPGLNLLAMPVLVIGGTLLALRHPPNDEA